MNIITDFDIEIDKDKVFQIIDCKKDSPVYDRVNNIYIKVLNKAMKLIKPKGIFKLEKTTSNYNYEIMERYSHLVSCLVTLGEDIGLASSKDFENGDYLEGLLLDTISDQILFNISNQMREKIIDYTKEIGIGLTPRMSPGENGVPIEVQKDILLRLEGKEKLGVDITVGYMLNPVKSLAYFYGADKNISISLIDHDCSKCGRADCKFKDDDFKDIKVLLGDEEKNIKVSSKENLLESLIKNKIVIESPCNGNGTCGKCKVQIVEGSINPTQNEISILTEEELKNNIRLACCIYPNESLTIKIDNINYKDFDILSNYKNSGRYSDPIVHIEEIESLKGDLDDQKSITHIINERLSNNYSFSLKAIRKLATSVNQDIKFDDDFSLYDEDRFNLIIYGNKIVDLSKLNETLAFGIAIDIGTTTIAVTLIDLLKKETVGTYTILNSQRQYGADVISRIQYSINDDFKTLTKCIKEDILKGIREICEAHKVDLDKIYNVTIAGNTTMVYLLLDIPAQSLAVSPFTTTTTFLMEYDFKKVFNDQELECKVVILPCISAYVGADIVSGMFNYDFDNLKGTTMLIDIGTNGEIVIGNEEKVYCAATAAGPAFEGANIKDGIGSIKGAVCSVDINKGTISYETIGNEKPIGICGSGVLDIVSSGLKDNIIDHTGRLDEVYEEGYIEIYKDEDKKICFYQKDIRELQLAKSAIRSGIDVLINKFGCSYDDIETVYLAGGFGNNLNIDSAINIGLIPKELQGKIKTAGNSSLGGVVDFLLNKNGKVNIDTIVNKTVYYELSTEIDFNNLFVENMMF
ncbi:ASKHA domain-containing protein [Wukongibacter baidiensis]|uniref:ASKHA domain-containing protein n=1 Tax=Wukongibacter baidiensis TaxID=1723361 RepID=UPI003D7FE954